MKRLILLVLCIFSAQFIFAQTFKNGIGIRAGWTPGFEYRLYTDDANSYKFLLGTREQGVQLHAFKEFHQYDLFQSTDRLVFFYGLGMHVGYERWDVEHYHDNMHWYKTRTAFLAGLDGLVGLEYIFYEVPLALGLEVKPYFDVLGQHMFSLQPFDFAFTVKYLF